MNKTKFLALIACIAVFSAPIVEAQAKRLGSGGNVGRVAPAPGAKPQAVPAKPATPAPQAAPQGQQAAKPAAPASAAQQPAKNSWLGQSPASPQVSALQRWLRIWVSAKS